MIETANLKEYIDPEFKNKYKDKNDKYNMKKEDTEELAVNSADICDKMKKDQANNNKNNKNIKERDD